MLTFKPAASNTPSSGNQYTPVASIATDLAPRSLSQSRNRCNSVVKVPKTSGGPPAMETCICSLPTSTKAASGSRTARLILLVVIRALTFLAASQARWRFWKRQIFPTGKPTRASPKCADIRHQSQSTLRAQGTKAHTATLLTTSHDAHPTKFMAREQVQMEHETTLG